LDYPRLPPSRSPAAGHYQPRRVVDIQAELEQEIARRRRDARNRVVADRRAQNDAARQAAMVSLPMDIEGWGEL